MHYIIFPNVTDNGAQLALSSKTTTTGGSRPGEICITVQSASNVTDDIIWNLVYDFNVNGFLMVNKATGTCIGIFGSNLLMTSTRSPSTSNTYLVTPGSNGFLKINPLSASGSFFNVYGGRGFAGCKVEIYSPSSGNSANEQWKFTVVNTDSPYGWFHTLRSNQRASNSSAYQYLSCNTSDLEGGVVVSAEETPPDDTQLWTPIWYIANNIQYGVVFINKYTGRVLCYAGFNLPTNATSLVKGMGAACFTVSPNAITTSPEGAYSCFWKVENTVTAGLNACIIRPSSGNNPARLNVFGARGVSGDAVCVYYGSSTTLNELWYLVRTSDEVEAEEINLNTADGFQFCSVRDETDGRSCVLTATSSTTDLIFRVNDLKFDMGVGFRVTAPDGTVYSEQHNGSTGGVWALAAENSTLGLQCFYISNPIAGVWTATVKVATPSNPGQWVLTGSTNTAVSGDSAESAFANMPPNEKRSAYLNMVKSPNYSTKAPAIPDELCFFCIIQVHLLEAVMIATFVFWAGPVTATSTVVLYAQRLLGNGSRAANLIANINTLYGLYSSGTSNYGLVKKLCELEGMCPAKTN